MNIDFVFDNEVDNFENNYEQDFTAIIEQALKTLDIEDDISTINHLTIIDFTLWFMSSGIK